MSESESEAETERVCERESVWVRVEETPPPPSEEGTHPKCQGLLPEKAKANIWP